MTDKQPRDRSVILDCPPGMLLIGELLFINTPQFLLSSVTVLQLYMCIEPYRLSNKCPSLFSIIDGNYPPQMKS